MPEVLAFREPARLEFDGAASTGHLVFESDAAMTVWSGNDTICTRTDGQGTLQIPLEISMSL